MPQLMLPLIPAGATQINDLVSILREKNRCIYFLGMYPIYSHLVGDLRMFRIFTSQLIDSGACRQIDIIKTFGISKSSVIRSLNKYQEGGAEAFFKPRKQRSGGTILTPDVIEQAQLLLDQGYSRSETAAELDVKYDTLRKAINIGRLREPINNKSATPATTKSSRDAKDAAAADGMGTACTRVEERVVASFGIFGGAPTQFEACLDVPNGGVLCALPALLANGLLADVDQLLGKIKGYYTTFHILLLLAFMALCRIKTVEKLRGRSPGEFGKLLGLDRIPEVRCLRMKMDALSSGDAAEKWAVHLSADWLKTDPEAIGSLYIDGHVRRYHGHLTDLPRKYVSRERLCLRGTTDYWVNDAIGRPYFVVEKAIDPGLLKTLEEDIVPRLLRDITNQPTEQELKDHPNRCRFILVFDREGYSPAFFSRMWKRHRVACLTYHKYPGADWPVEWFSEHEVTMPRGEVVSMRLAEIGSLVGSGKDAVWMREVRKLTDSGHQTSVISTAYELIHIQLAARMFSRWCQENFFKYMMEHFAIDLLIEYGTESFPATEKVVNPIWRELIRARNSLLNKLRYRRASFAEMTLRPEAEGDQVKYHKWLKQKGELLEEIEHYERQLLELKMKLRETSRHIDWLDLNEEDKFYRLLPGRKRLMDTVRMIAYRAETAMVGMIFGSSIDTAAARRLLQDLFVTEADVLPEVENGNLRIRVHNASRPAANRSLAKLFEQLNEAAIKYPGTDLTLVYELGGEGVAGQGGHLVSD